MIQPQAPILLAFRNYLLLLFFLLATGQAYSQEVRYSKNGTFYDVELEGMEDFLVPFKGNNPPDPRYDFLWITNDGQYYFTENKNVATHGFDLGVIGIGPDNASMRTYATPIYSDHEDDPPPKIIISIDTVVAPIAVTKTRSLPDSGSVRLQRSNLSLVPEDTSVFIISLANNIGQEFDQPLSGYVVFFYDGQLQVYDKDADSKELSSEPVERKSSSENIFTSFDFEETLIYEGNLLPAFSESLPVEGSGTSDFFKNMRIYRFDTLMPGQERNLFIQMRNDELHLDAIPSGAKGGTNFLAAMVVDNQIFDQNSQLSIPPFSSNDSQLIDELNLPGFFDGTITIPGDDPTSFRFNGQLVGLSAVNAEASLSHDPNEILLEACKCPPQEGERQKIVVKVDFENEGLGATSDVKVRIPFPEEFDVSTVRTDSLLSLFPSSPGLMGSLVIEVDPATNEVVVNLPGLRLEGKTDHSDNYLDRVGHIAFSILAEPDADLSTLPAVQACIQFDSGTEVCTVPRKVKLYTSDELASKLAEEVLECQDCAAATTTGSSSGSNIWFLILLIIVLGIALYFALRQDDEEGSPQEPEGGESGS